MNSSGIIHIAPWQLGLASVFIVASIAVIWAMKFGLGKRLAWAAVRSYVQLLILGYVLSWLFHLDSGLMVIAVLLIMSGVAAITVSRRVSEMPGKIIRATFTVLFGVCLLITFTVTGLIVQVHPWYLPRYVIPVAGMVLGNSMASVAIALERVFRDLDARSDEIRGLVALGATPREAADASIRSSLIAGLIPSINTLATAGVVFIPGMMSGQILAGTAPGVAAPYQIVILFMVTAASLFSSTTAILLVYKHRFDKFGAYIDESVREPSGT